MIKERIANALVDLKTSDKWKYIKYNFLSKNFNFKSSFSRIITYKHSVVEIAPTAQVEINGIYNMNDNKPKKSKAESYLVLEDNAKLNVDGFFSVYYNSEVIVYENATLDLGTVVMNAGAQIRCKEKISIGSGSLIARNVMIMDFDIHRIKFSDGRENKKTAPINIGKNVWLCVGATVLEGVTIGEGSVISAGSLVTHDIPPHCLAGGVPAKVLKENISWKS